MLSNKAYQYMPLADASTRNHQKRQFWQSIPRFEREYSFGDLLQALPVLLSENVGDTTITRQFSAAHGFLFQSGRQCLFPILTALRLRARSRLGIPLSCCRAV